jgi:hypothetical protein
LADEEGIDESKDIGEELDDEHRYTQSVEGPRKHCLRDLWDVIDGERNVAIRPRACANILLSPTCLWSSRLSATDNCHNSPFRRVFRQLLLEHRDLVVMRPSWCREGALGNKLESEG